MAPGAGRSRRPWLGLYAALASILVAVLSADVVDGDLFEDLLRDD